MKIYHNFTKAKADEDKNTWREYPCRMPMSFSLHNLIKIEFCKDCCNKNNIELIDKIKQYGLGLFNKYRYCSDCGTKHELIELEKE